MRILTGIDLPFEPSCGSMILSDNIYSSLPKDVHARFLSLESDVLDRSWSGIEDLVLLNIKKVYDEGRYNSFVDELYKEVEKNIYDYKPDILHIQHLSFGMALAFSRVKNIPKISLCHGTDVLFSIDNDFHKENVKKICNVSDYVIFPTEAVYNDLRRIVGIDLGVKAKIVPWGIPGVEEINSDKKYNKNKIELLYAGRISENKGVDVIVEALRILPENYHLTIIGSGPCEENIELLVKKIDVNDRINFVPFLTRKKLWEKFSEYDAMIVPTKEVESFCLIAVEAQAHNLPVVYSNTSGLSEVLGESGIKFEPKNPEDLSKRIQELFDSSNYNKIIQRGRDNASKFKIEKTINGLIKYSRELI